jgi:hypothetical protein
VPQMPASTAHLHGLLHQWDPQCWHQALLLQWSTSPAGATALVQAVAVLGRVSSPRVSSPGHVCVDG